MEDKPFALVHSNVDGAGSLGRFATLEEAKTEADRLQAVSDACGNPWRYSYAVFVGIDRCVYRTTAAPIRFEARQTPNGWVVVDRVEHRRSRHTGSAEHAHNLAAGLIQHPAYAVEVEWVDLSEVAA